MATTLSVTPVLVRLRDHIVVARRGEDPEGVHQVRVSTRKIDVWLRLGDWRVLRDDLAWLRRGASAVRDLDVALRAPAAVGAFAAWLERERGRARRDLLAVLGDPRLEGLLAALASLPPVRVDRARRPAREMARRLLARGAAIESGPADVGPYHRLRRSLRRCRYALEWLGELRGKEYAELQDALGALGDRSFLVDLIERCPHGAGLAARARELRGGLDRCRAESIEIWRRLRRRAGEVA